MNWTQWPYFANTDISNKLVNGYKLVVNDINPSPSDVDDDYDEFVLTVLSKMKNRSFYEVGFGLGKLLISLHKLRKDAKVGGCELSDLNISYGNKNLGLLKYHLVLDIIDIHNISNRQYDVVFCVDLFSQSQDQNQLLKSMLNVGKKVVLFERGDLFGNNVNWSDYVTSQIKGKAGSALVVTTVEESVDESEFKKV